jgi:hypothetical protein
MSSFNIYLNLLQCNPTENSQHNILHNKQPATNERPRTSATERDRACPGGSSRSQESQIGFDAHEDSVGTNHQTHDEVEDAAASA